MITKGRLSAYENIVQHEPQITLCLSEFKEKTNYKSNSLVVGNIQYTCCCYLSTIHPLTRRINVQTVFCRYDLTALSFHMEVILLLYIKVTLDYMFHIFTFKILYLHVLGYFNTQDQLLLNENRMCLNFITLQRVGVAKILKLSSRELRLIAAGVYSSAHH